MEKQIILLPSKGYLWLCDDYPFEIRLLNIVYPSIRHAVLSWKTDDVELKKEISKTGMPADLKDLENSIKNPSKENWVPGKIKVFFENYTNKKFTEIKDLGEKLLATSPAILKKQLLPSDADLSINELQRYDNFETKILMQVRHDLLNQKAP